MTDKTLIASGRSADVFDAGRDRVRIRYREPRDVLRQAGIIERVIAAGFPAPHVHEVGDGELVVERVDGPTMFEDLIQHPDRLDLYAAMLARLHDQLHRLGICHHDLHPLNIILGPKGPVVIDWEAADEAGAATDLAETWLLLATADVPAELRGPADRFLDAFLSHVDRDAARRALPEAVAIRRQDPHMTSAELGRMEDLLANQA